MASPRLVFMLWILPTLCPRVDCEKNLPSPPPTWCIGQENNVICDYPAGKEGVFVVSLTLTFDGGSLFSVHEAHEARYKLYPLGENSLKDRLASSRTQLPKVDVRAGQGEILVPVSMTSTSWSPRQMDVREDLPQRKCRKGTVGTWVNDCKTSGASRATTHAYTTRKDGLKQNLCQGAMFPCFPKADTMESFVHRAQQHDYKTEGTERPRHNRRLFRMHQMHITQGSYKKNTTVRQKPSGDSCHVLFYQNESKLSAENYTVPDLCSDEGTMGISHNESYQNKLVPFLYRCDEKNYYHQNQTWFGHDLTSISFYITTMVTGNEVLKHKLRPLFRALPRAKSIETLICLILESITGSHNPKNSSVTEDLHLKDALDGHTSKKGKIPCLHSGRFSYNCGSKATPKPETEHKILSGSGNPRKDDFCKNISGLSQYFRAFSPRRPPVYTVFPASFLPAMGASIKESMAHLGSRLASLNALPSSCDISKVRLAEAGFYYDNSKTARDASNVHEVVCYSCGLVYSQWNKGDNPVTIHSNLRPDCEHIRGRNVSYSTPPASSAIAGQSFVPDGSPLSSPSGVSMTDPNSSTLSSGHGSIMTESLQGSSVPRSSLSTTDSGTGTGSFSAEAASSRDFFGDGMPGERRDNDRRNDGGDLATDCSSIPPSTPARPSNQSSSSGMARDSAARPRQLPYQSSYTASRDTSRARAQDLDDRPPLDMTCAVYPQFCRHQERRATFSDWPLADLFHPDDLVMQGFYYAGYADCLRCFYCGVGLKSWAENDDVMVEHIRWRPSCGYVLNTKGRHFVQSVLNSLGQVSSNGEQNNSSRDSTNESAQLSPASATATTNSSSNGTATQNSTTTAAQAPVRSLNASTNANTTASSASASASQPAATATVSSSSAGGNASKEVLRKVEEMGFSKNAIARAVRHFQQAGMTKTSVDALVEKILELDLEDDGHTTANSSEHPNGLQTDGPEGASNYDLDADIQRAQRIISENERLKARQTCKLCKRAQVGMIFLPCGHILACTQCGSKTRNCTHCGEFIRATANVYLS